jgi:hypothetical protein
VGLSGKLLELCLLVGRVLQLLDAVQRRSVIAGRRAMAA